MPTENPAQTEAEEPFDSLLQLRAEHVEMMRAVRRAGAGADLVPRIRAFIDRVKATGRRIDSPPDRDAAENIIAYWSSYLFTATESDALSAALPTLDPFDPANAVDLSAQANPYQGLKPFRQTDAAHFIGREEAVKILLDKLRDHPVVLVSGPMGSGKTSLVTAGAIPRLNSRLLTENKDPLFVIVVPGRDPFAALLGSIHEAAATSTLPGLANFISEQTKKIERSPEHLRTLLETVFPDRPVMIVVDQFEQLFTLCADPKIREQFARAVSAVAVDPRAPNRVVLVVHERYRAPTLQLAALELLAHTPGALFSPPPPTAQEVRRIIENVATSVGLKFDEGIVEDLVKEVLGDAGALPTLQFTLSKLWDERQRDRITWDVYRKVGRPREALNRTAEAVFKSLTPDEQRVSKELFLALASPTIEGDFVLRRIRRDDLAQLDLPELVSRVLERYVEAGLIRHIPGSHWDDDHFDIIHEALVHHWPRLGDWLQKEREESEKKLRLLASARLWQESGFKPDYLLTGDALEAAAAYTENAPDLKEFVTASRKEAQRAARRLVRIQSAVIAIMAVLLVAAVWGWSRAGKEAAIARQNAATAFDTVRGMLSAILDEANRGAFQVEPTKKLLAPASSILKSIGPQPELLPARITLLNTLSDVYALADDKKEALVYAKEAESSARQLVDKDPDNDDWQYLLYGSFFRIGDMEILMEEADAQKALAKYESALAIAQALAAKHPADGARQSDIAFIENKIGDIFLIKKELQKSIEWYQKALAIGDLLLVKDPSNPDRQKTVADAKMRIGDLYADQPNRSNDALAQYESALQIRKALAERDPGNDVYQSNLSTAYFHLGELYKKDNNKLAEALTCYQTALGISEPQARNDPSKVDWQVRLARLHAAIAEIHVKRHEFDTALQEYDGALQIRSHLAENFPDSRVRARELAAVYESIGDTLRDKHAAANGQNASPDAIGAYRKGLAVIEAFMAKKADRGLEGARDKLQRKIQGLTPNVQ